MKKLVLILTVCALAHAVCADVILQYNFTGSVATPSTQGTGATGSVFSASQGSFAFGTATASTATGGPTAPSVTTSSWLTPNNYWAFTLSLGQDGQLADSPSSLSLSFTYRASGTGPTAYEWQYDNGGGFTTIGSGAMTANSAWQAQVNTPASTLNGVGGTINFRLYGTGTTASTGTWAVDNVTLNGTVIPEPTIMVMMGLGVIGIMVARRFRRG